jgi:hypothetical protein
MASQASAAAGVVTDWAGGADRSRGARLAFYNEQLAEAQAHYWARLKAEREARERQRAEAHIQMSQDPYLDAAS